MTAKEQKLGYDSGNVSALDKVKRFASRNGALIGLIILCIILSIGGSSLPDWAEYAECRYSGSDRCYLGIRPDFCHR